MHDVPFMQLCWTGTTLYGLDRRGRIWFINMKNGEWELADQPQEPKTD